MRHRLGFRALGALAAATAIAVADPQSLSAQISGVRTVSADRSLAGLQRLVEAITVTPRVLVVGMHPDDEPSELIAWLSRGRHIETAYLSVTRGEAGRNENGIESGSLLGALRVQEALNSRRIDGAHQFYTRAYDFGEARDEKDAFTTWVRDSLVADVVTVIRSFRPQIMISVLPDSVMDGNGQHMALATIVDHAFTSSNDPRRFPAKSFGAPWPVAKLYNQGSGLTIDANEFDRALGMTYAEVALMVRSQRRTQGLSDVAHGPATTVSIKRIASRVNHHPADSSLFYEVDTTVARLAKGIEGSDVILAHLVATADSARVALDLSNPSAIVPQLARVSAYATQLRQRAPRCNHPSPNARPVLGNAPPPTCDANALDLDASIDVIRDRANEALLTAAGVVIEAISDRELIAASDTAKVTLTVANHGTRPFALFSVDMWGLVGEAFPRPGHAITIAPDSVVTLTAPIAHIELPRQWWIGQRTAERFDDTTTSMDGIARGSSAGAFAISGIAVPDDIRRISDVTVTLDILGTTVKTSLGPIVYRFADAQHGMQVREVAGIPDITFRFSRSLSWVPRNKPFAKTFRVGVKSFTDRPVTLGIGKLAPDGVLVDSIPKELKLAGREQREFAVPIRGKLSANRRVPFGIWGVNADGTTYQTGFQSVEREYIDPVRVFRSSGIWLQPVDIAIPPGLTVLYVPDNIDDTRSALQEVGVFAREVSSDQLLTAELKGISTIVIAPRALERYPELAAQSRRLNEFVRNGGTLVIQRGSNLDATLPLLPYPVSLAPQPERVVHSDAPVTALQPQSRLLTWPNRITKDDWDTWISGRAQFLPSSADPRYARVIEVHDPGAKPNTNAILAAKVGKGTVIYTTLTFEEQIGGGSTGALRLLVNLLSAGLPLK
jgi:LmbE family N-acetylglucosaminyl deacetylase